MTAMTEMVATVEEVAKNSGEAAVAASNADSETVAGGGGCWMSYAVLLNRPICWL